jgi:hypothetical protein
MAAINSIKRHIPRGSSMTSLYIDVFNISIY